MRDGFIKIAAATPDLHVADCEYNAAEIVKQAKQAAAKGAKLITFPELCLTGYTCGDLFLQETLLEGRRAVLGSARHRYHFSVRRAAAVHLRRRDLRGSVGAESAVYYIGADGHAHYRQPVCFR